MTNRTATFLGNFEDQNDPEILSFKERVKVTNKKLRESDHKTRLRLKLRGRGEKVTKSNLRYYKKEFKKRNGFACGPKYAILRLKEDLPLPCAESIDVYIHTELLGVHKTNNPVKRLRNTDI